jgi:hypothetical protein
MLATILFTLLSSCLLSKNLKIKIYKTIILPVLLYGYETLSLMLREEHRLRKFENRVLRITFGPKKEEVVGGSTSENIIRLTKSRSMRLQGM